MIGSPNGTNANWCFEYGSSKWATSSFTDSSFASRRVESVLDIVHNSINPRPANVVATSLSDPLDVLEAVTETGTSCS
jgi:hypothetical protein